MKDEYQYFWISYTWPMLTEEDMCVPCFGNTNLRWKGFFDSFKIARWIEAENGLPPQTVVILYWKEMSPDIFNTIYDNELQNIANSGKKEKQ